jgi:hypothetical protein
MGNHNNRSTNNGVTKIKTERKEPISTAAKFKIDFHLKGKYLHYCRRRTETVCHKSPKGGKSIPPL